MNKTRVWFNHWFSTVYHIIGLMRQAADICVIGSNKNEESVMGLACDELYTEPWDISGDEYAEFCLEFCRMHNIDVFAPRRERAAISRRAADFEKIGVKLLMDTDPVMMNILNSKTETYRLFADLIPEAIPEYYEVTDLDGFISAYNNIIKTHDRACFKFADDEGASSFRVIDNRIIGAEGLFKAPGLKVTYDKAIEIFSEYDFEKSIIVMPYLSGTEVSADCLATSEGNIIIPRYKPGGRIYTVKYEPEIMECCEKILARTGLEMPCNIQFIYDNGKPMLLEINTRMSGGVQLSCAAAGVNIPGAALNKLSGKPVDISYEKTERHVSYIETPVTF